MSFFNTSGVDIDGLWIDMNEASNFCYYPCSNPEAFAIFNGDPPTPPQIRPDNPLSLPGWPADLQPTCEISANFLLNVSTISGQALFMTGNVPALGDSLFVPSSQRLILDRKLGCLKRCPS